MPSILRRAASLLPALKGRLGPAIAALAVGSVLMAAPGSPQVDVGTMARPIVRSVTEVLVVDSRSDLGTNTITALEPGRPYVIEASGTYSWGLGTADAECSTQGSDTTFVRSRYAEPVVDLVLNGADVAWQPLEADANECNTAGHAYRTVLTVGEAQQLNFRVTEGPGGYLGDNDGRLTVTILDQAVEGTVDAVRGEADRVRGEGETTASTVRDTVTGVTPSTLPSLPPTTLPPAPTTTVPTGPTTTVPTGPTTTIPEAPTTTMPEAPATTAPEGPTTTIPGGPGGDPDPGPVAEAVADFLDDLEASGLPSGVPPQPDPDPDPGPSPDPDPGSQPVPTTTPGSPPVGAPAPGPSGPPEREPGPGEDGDPGSPSPANDAGSTRRSATAASTAAGAGAPSVTGAQAAARNELAAEPSGSVGPTQTPTPSGAGTALGLADDAFLERDVVEDETPDSQRWLPTPVDVAARGRWSGLFLAAGLLAATLFLGGRALIRTRTDRATRAYRYR